MTIPNTVKERAKKLHKLLAHHAHRYYTLDAPEIAELSPLLALHAQEKMIQFDHEN